MNYTLQRVHIHNIVLLHTSYWTRCNYESLIAMSSSITDCDRAKIAMYKRNRNIYVILYFVIREIYIIINRTL